MRMRPKPPISVIPPTWPCSRHPGDEFNSERRTLCRKPSRCAGSSATARAHSMPVFWPMTRMVFKAGEAGPAVSSIATSGLQPRQRRCVMIWRGALDSVLPFGAVVQTPSGACALAVHSCATAPLDPMSNAANRAASLVMKRLSESYPARHNPHLSGAGHPDRRRGDDAAGNRQNKRQPIAAGRIVNDA